MEKNETTKNSNNSGLAERAIERADRRFELFEVDEAIELYRTALRLLEPAKSREEDMFALALTSLGDCFFIKGDHKEALGYYLRAFMLSNGYANAYALMRAGEVYYELGALPKARHYLVQAYLIEGYSLFESEDLKYYELIRNEELLREV